MEIVRRRLFEAQGDEWADAGGAAGWDPAGEQGDGEEQRRDGGVGDRIAGRDAVEEIGEKARACKRGGQTDKQAKPDDAKALAQDHLEDVARSGSNGHADTDFMRALRCGVGSDAVDANDSEDEA